MEQSSTPCLRTICGAYMRDSEDAKEAYEERAGILEFDAGMSRADAEKMAAEMVADDDEAEFTMGAGD